MAKIIYQIYLIFIVRIVSSADNSFAPVIKLNGEVVGNREAVTLNLSAEYAIKCQSEYKVKLCKFVHGVKQGKQFLDIYNPWYIETASVFDIGTYFCVSWSIFMNIISMDIMPDMAAKEITSRVDIFVKDTKQPLVPSDEYNLTVWQYSVVTIPCRPSYTPLQIELLRENNSSLGVPYTYNEMIGYTIRMIDPSLNGTTLICRTRIENQDFSHKFHLEVQQYRKFINKPEIRIISHPNFNINEGDDVTLNCSVFVPKGLDYKMRWNMREEDSGVTVMNMTRDTHPDSAELEIGTIQLIQKHVNWNVYYCDCSIYDDYDSNTERFAILINRSPSVEMEPVETYITNGEVVTLDCKHSGFPPTTVNVFEMICNPKHPWNCSNEKILDSHETFFRSVFYLNQETTISFKPSEPSIVRCEAGNFLGNISAISRVRIDDLNEVEDFVIFKTNFKELIMTSDNVTLTCAAKSRLFKSVQWYRNGELISNESGIRITPLNFKYSLRTKLHFQNITIHESGTYECRVENVTAVFNKSVEIRVEEYEPRITETNLRIRKMIRSVGESLELHCNFSGKPTPNITWLKDGVEITGKNGSKSISIHAITAQDFGTYKCVVRNEIGEVEESTKVINETHLRLNLTQSTIENIATDSRLDLTLGIIALVAVLLVCIIYIFIRERNLRKELKAAGLDNFELGAIDRINPDQPLEEQADLLPYNSKFEFPKDKLKLGRQLGSGAFGVVLQAIALQIHPEEEKTVVAVKVVQKMADSTIMKALVSELKIMANLGRHLNIVNLLGAVTKNIAKRDFMIILEYCPFGNLQDHLLKNRRNFVDQFDPETKQLNSEITESQASHGAHYENTTALNLILNHFNSVSEGESKISTTNLIAWAFQIARGMEYLASRRVLHGDLAARNVLLCDQNIVKLCDFGLARSLYKNCVYKKDGDALLPVRWLAPESIGDKVFGTFSDVWSFGIVLWELFSLATSPYPGMELNEEWFLRIKDGYRMGKPEYASDSIYNVMLRCWELEPKSRPSFSELQNEFGSMLPIDVARHFIGLNGTYMEWNTEQTT